MSSPAGILIRKVLRCSAGLLFAGALLATGKAAAQSLRVEEALLPDSALFDFRVQARFTIRNQTEANQLGNLKLWILNPAKDSTVRVLGEFSALQLFAPNQRREFELEVNVTPELFIDGGNTVVIWPSFVGQPEISTDSAVVDIFITSLNAAKPVEDRSELILVENPVNEMLSIRSPSGVPQFRHCVLLDLSCRVLYSGNRHDLDVSSLVDGVYFLQILTDSGDLLVRRIVKRAR